MRIQVHRNTCIHVYNYGRNEKQTIKTTERTSARPRKSAERNERKQAAARATWTTRKGERANLQDEEHDAPPPLLFGIVLYNTKQPSDRPRPTATDRERDQRDRPIDRAQPRGTRNPSPLFSVAERVFSERRALATLFYHPILFVHPCVFLRLSLLYSHRTKEGTDDAEEVLRRDWCY